jgi:hypothetical protein
MSPPHRYTGEFPPIEVIDQFPNWDYALDEEGEPGQDETTIRPQSEQSFVTDDTAFTAVDVWLASTEQFVGIAEVLSCSVEGIEVLEPTGSWRVFFHRPSRTWRAFTQDWLPQEDRCRSVPLTDTRAFPMRFATRLPAVATGKPCRLEIHPDGTAVEW